MSERPAFAYCWPICLVLLLANIAVQVLASAGLVGGPAPLSVVFSLRFPFLVLPVVLGVFAIGWQRIPLSRLVAGSLVLPLAFPLLFFALHVTTVLCPVLLDRRLADSDVAAGLGTFRWLCTAIVAVPGVSELSRWIYDSLPLVVAMPAAVEAVHGEAADCGLLPNFLLAACLGFLFYFAVPAIGPRYFFGAEHIQPIALGHLAAGYQEPPNAFPSLHFTWACLAFLSTRRCAIGVRAGSAVVVIGTILATVGFGFHYATDLVAALPLVLVVRAISGAGSPEWAPKRLIAAATGLALLAFWVALLRGQVDLQSHDVAMRLAMLATVITSIALERWIAVGEGAYLRRNPVSSPLTGALSIGRELCVKEARRWTQVRRRSGPSTG